MESCVLSVAHAIHLTKEPARPHQLKALPCPNKLNKKEIIIERKPSIINYSHVIN